MRLLFFSDAKNPEVAENSQSVKINEGPLSLIFSLPEKSVQGPLLIETRQQWYCFYLLAKMISRLPCKEDRSFFCNFPIS